MADEPLWTSPFAIFNGPALLLMFCFLTLALTFRVNFGAHVQPFQTTFVVPTENCLSIGDV